MLKYSFYFLLPVVILIMSACGNNDDYERAVLAYQNEDYISTIYILENTNLKDNLNLQDGTDILLAKSYFSLGNYRKAIEIALESSSMSYEMMELLSNALMEEGEHDKAIEVLKDLILSFGDNPELLNDIGLNYDAMGMNEQALEYYNRALLIDPGFCLSWNNKGMVNEYNGNYNEAIICYNNAIESCDSVDVFYFNRGVSKMYLGAYVEALNDFQDALRFSDENNLSLFKFNLALAYFKLDSLERACGIFISLGTSEGLLYYQEYCSGNESSADVEI